MSPESISRELVIYLTQVTARSCGCERPDSRGGMGHQAGWWHGKRLGRCPRAQAIVVGIGALRVAPWVRTSRHAHSKGSPSPDQPASPTTTCSGHLSQVNNHLAFLELGPLLGVV